MGGSMGVIREERGCSGLSSEAEKLLHTEAGLRVCVCLSESMFIRCLYETMSF